MDSAAILEVIYSAIDSVNELRQADSLVPKTPDVVLAGEGGLLDSLALITLILAVERRVADVTGREINLMDGDQFDPQFRQFATPTAFAQFVQEKLMNA